MRYIGLLVAVAAVLTTVGCASIVSKSEYPVTISSTPSGASFTVKNDKGIEIHHAVTPSTVTLPSGAGYFKPASYTIAFEKEGSGSTTRQLKGNLNPWYLGNIIFGGLIGMVIVDPLTGAMWKLDHNVSADLPAFGAKAPASPAGQTAGAQSPAAPAAGGSENPPKKE